MMDASSSPEILKSLEKRFVRSTESSSGISIGDREPKITRLLVSNQKQSESIPNEKELPLQKENDYYQPRLWLARGK